MHNLTSRLNPTFIRQVKFQKALQSHIGKLKRNFKGEYIGLTIGWKNHLIEIYKSFFIVIVGSIIIEGKYLKDILSPRLVQENIVDILQFGGRYRVRFLFPKRSQYCCYGFGVYSLESHLCLKIIINN